MMDFFLKESGSREVTRVLPGIFRLDPGLVGRAVVH